MKKYIIFAVIIIAFNSIIVAQDKGKVQFGVEVPVKISIGKDTRQIFNYKGIETLNYPYYTSYRNPVYGINLGVMYGLSKSFKIGVSAGLNGEYFETNPIFINEYYNMMMIPVYGKIRYEKNLKGKITLMADLNAGYQFFDNRFENDTSGFYFTDTGGFLGGIDLGAAYRTSKYMFSLKLGYEMNIYSHAYRLDWGVHPANITQNDIVNFYTFYRLLKVTVGINFL